MMNFAMASLNTKTFILLLIDLDSYESYHNESEVYYTDEMTNDNEKEKIGAIAKEENLKLDERLLTLKCNYNSLKICSALWA